MDESLKREKMARLEQLKSEHAELERRLLDLTSRAYLSPKEQIEMRRLKKLKLRKKDEIFLLMAEIEKF